MALAMRSFAGPEIIVRSSGALQPRDFMIVSGVALVFTFAVVKPRLRRYVAAVSMIAYLSAGVSSYRLRGYRDRCAHNRQVIAHLVLLVEMCRRRRVPVNSLCRVSHRHDMLFARLSSTRH